MTKINLLPPELTPNRSMVRLTNIITKMSYVMVIVLLITVITMFGIFITNSFKIKSLNNQQKKLVEEVKKYEQTEQQITLAKERIITIKDIWSQKNVSKSLDSVERLLSYVDTNIVIQNLLLSSTKNEISFDSVSTDSVSKFLGNVMVSDIYEKIVLKSFSFNPRVGYKISFEGVLK